MKLSVLALALVSIAALSSTAVRAEEREVKQSTVSIRDVDMNDTAAVARLYQRLERVAVEVCKSEVNSGRVALADRACAKEALEQAIESIGDKRLMAYHAETASTGSTLASGRTDKSELDD